MSKLEDLLVSQSDLPRLRQQWANAERMKKTVTTVSAKGHRVQMSELALNRGVNRKSRSNLIGPSRGIVTGESKNGKFLWVRLDGCATSKRYATEYFDLESEPVPEGNAASTEASERKE